MQAGKRATCSTSSSSSSMHERSQAQSQRRCSWPHAAPRTRRAERRRAAARAHPDRVTRATAQAAYRSRPPTSSSASRFDEANKPARALHASRRALRLDPTPAKHGSRPTVLSRGRAAARQAAWPTCTRCSTATHARSDARRRPPTARRAARRTRARKRPAAAATARLPGRGAVRHGRLSRAVPASSHAPQTRSETRERPAQQGRYPLPRRDCA